MILLKKYAVSFDWIENTFEKAKLISGFERKYSDQYKLSLFSLNKCKHLPDGPILIASFFSLSSHEQFFGQKVQTYFWIVPYRYGFQ